MRRILGLIPNVFLLGLVSLFNDFSAEMIYAVMPVFLVGVLGAPPLVLGIIEGFADATASILKIVSGWFSDRFKKRKAISVSGYGLSIITRLGLYFVGNFWQVFAIRVLDRVGKGVRESPRDALLAESVPRAEVGKSFGYLRAMDQVGGILGPLVAIIILPIISYDYRLLFVIGFGIGAFVLLSFLFVKDVKPVSGENISKVRPPLTFSISSFGSDFKIFIASIFLFGLGVMPVSLILLKAQDLSVSGLHIPLMYLIYSVAFAATAIPFGKLSDSIGERKVMVSGFITAIFAYIILGASSGIFGIVLGFVIFGLYSAMTDGVARSIVSKMVSPDTLASGEGFLGAVIGISSLLAGVVGGLLWTAYGAQYAFIYGAAFMILGLIVFLALNPKQDKV
ncbi:MAG TPA: MFS transporter [Candidatus Paceibacterota bacterium]